MRANPVRSARSASEAAVVAKNREIYPASPPSAPTEALAVDLTPCRRGDCVDRAGSSVVADSDKSESPLGHLLAMVSAKAPRPRFDVNFERGSADILDRRVNAEHIADLDRTDEGHGVDGDCDDASLGPFDGCDAAGLVHLAQHPAAKDVAIGVGVLRHGDEADRQFAMRFKGWR